METAEKKAGVQGANAKANAAANKVENRPNLTGKEAKQNEPAKNEKPGETSQSEATKTVETKTGSSVAVGNQPANGQQHPAKAEVKEVSNAGANEAEPKAEIKYIKPALNLEQTLKTVNGLHRLTIQRLALIGRIEELENFEIALIEEGDELSSNHFNKCRLIIEDDKHRQFVTNTPNLIQMVSQFLHKACVDKLAEIEAHIVFPNA